MRKAMAENGCGHLGNYDCCSFTIKGLGRFRPLKGASPLIGDIGQIEEVEEDRIETICSSKSLELVLAAIKKAHPYEEPVVDVYPLLS